MESEAAVRAVTISGPDAHTRAPQAKLPAGACDCHAHVFGPQQKFPYVPEASFIPPDATGEDYVRMLRTLGCERGVLVQPSIYGTDNSCMVSVLKSGLLPMRGIAVVSADVSDQEIESLHEAGVRGVRINVASTTKAIGMDQVPRLAARIKRFDWHLQFYVRIAETPSFIEEAKKLPVPCVIDHFAGVQASGGVQSEAFAALLKLARLENVWFKLMGPYRISKLWPMHPDIAPMGQALLETAPHRCVWATDWPHPNAKHVPNCGDLADALAGWIPDAAARSRVLVDNPAKLYDFR
jgi:predicted TIM-barrel fold metal-dependent hydrolase